MGLNSNLPVLVPAVITLIIVSAFAGFALVWNQRPQIRVLVRRVWLVAVAVIVGGVAVFWISTAMVQGPHRATISRSLQQQQQDELRQRLRNGGH